MSSLLGSAWRTLGHAAVWAALYSAACTLMVAQLALGERDPGEGPVLFAALTGLGVYLLDRAKLSDAGLDPADAEAQPDRHAFIRRWARVLRLSALGCLVAATVLGAWMRWVLAPAPWIGAVAVLFYGGGLAWPRGRLKRWLIVKNLVVAAGLAGFAGVAVELDRFLLADPRRIGLALVTVVLVVFADAVLCDLADAEADRGAGTRTIPTVFGGKTTWGVAMALEAGAVALAPLVGHKAWDWSVPILATTPALMLVPTRAVRDLVDMRLTLVAVFAWVLWA